MKHPWNSQAFEIGARAAGRSVDTIRAAGIAARFIKQSSPDLPVVLTLAHLAHLTDVRPETLRQVVDRKTDPYRVFRLKKRSRPGDASASRPFRTICVPSPPLMRMQRWIAQNILNIVEPHPASYAFAPGRDLVGAAERHVGCRWLIKMDVQHFFESILETAVYRVFYELGYVPLVAFELARLCTRVHSREHPLVPLDGTGTLPYRRWPEGHLPQGAPTSPMLANLAVRRLDEQLTGIARVEGWTYSRYADDLAFSTTDRSSRGEAMALVKLVERKLLAFGLSANKNKTSIVPPGARKILLGVLVDRDQVRLTKEFRNNIETHVYALAHPRIGPSSHQAKRGFASRIGMKRHVLGLIAFAHQVDPMYARKLYAEFDRVDWSG